ncbi:DUF1433 domain-containing protein [Listeria valentina]|uniref:DUF1433 domain-containing protein n=1 Tax=Listeria valentina TaxID=2705293 RepID=UPI001FE6AE44|nr:DUF1433 domain-containing protein [Listeria valentina]
MKHKEQEKKERAFFNEQEEKVIVYLKYNVPSYKSVTFTNEEFNPIGLSIDGYINNDKRLSFTAGKDVRTFSYSEELDKMFKTPTKSYIEIMKEKKTKAPKETSMTDANKQAQTMEEIIADARAREAQIFNRNRLY